MYKFTATLNLILVIPLLLFSMPSLATAVKIAAIDIEGLHQRDGNGEYDKTILNTFSSSEQNVEIKVYSPSRVFKLFETGKVDCISPANQNPDFYSFNFKTRQSKPMFQAKIYIYSPSGTEPYTTLEQLKGKTVGIRGSMVYGNEVENSGLNFKKTKDIESNIKSLNRGEIDAIIAYWPDSDAAFEGLGIEPLPRSEAITTHDDSVVCRESYTNNEFIDVMNKSP